MRCENCNKSEVLGYSLDDVPLCKKCGEGLEKDEKKRQQKRKQKADFWFWKNGRKHWANQSDTCVHDISEGIQIPTDNFNYQLDVGLIEDIGVE